MIRRRVPAVVATAAAAMLTLSGCSDMTWDQKVEALKNAADRGADAHYVLITQNKKPNKGTCTENYSVFMGDDNPPQEFGGVSRSSIEWQELHLSYFVDSCVSGTPRQPATRPKTPSPAPSTASPTADADTPADAEDKAEDKAEQ